MHLLDLASIVRELQENLQLNDEQLAWVVGVEGRTIDRWHHNRNFPHGKNREALEALQDVVRRLDETFVDQEGARQWLKAPGRYLGQFTPREALLAHRIDRVIGALEGIASGVYIRCVDENVRVDRDTHQLLSRSEPRAS